MERESEAGGARIVIARAALAAEVASRGRPPLALARQRLAAATELGRLALRDRPASWEAPLLLGAATALDRSRARDARLFSGYRDWEAPLEAAVARAPAVREPGRFLASAYLEVWPALSAAKRPEVERLLRDAFTDPVFFERLVDPWLAIAGSAERAAQLLPDSPATWNRLVAWSAGRRDWPGVARLELRRRAALAAQLAGRLAAARSRAGDPRRVAAERAEFAELAAAVPLAKSQAPLFEAVLAERPAGPAGERLARASAAWLRWAIPLCLLGDCPLSAPAFERIASTAATELAPEENAIAALLAGDTARAELVERRADSSWASAWAPYLVLKAERLRAAGDVAGARTALEGVNRDWWERASFRRAWEAVRGPGAAADPVAAGRTLQPLAREAWEASDWTIERGSARLGLVAARGARGLVLQLEEAAAGGVFALEWDGELGDPQVLPEGAAEATIALEVTPGAHLARLVPISGEAPKVARVALVRP